MWDFNADARRKPKHTLTTIAPANNLSWRPSRNSKLDTTQIATCAFNTDHRVQIWDFKRPYVPVRTLDVHDNVTTGILWKDEDILWSCSRDSTLVQSDVPFAPQQINSMTYTALSWSPEGDFTFVGQRRGKNRQHATSGSRSTFETDEDISNREERRSHGRHNSFKSSKPILNINIFDTAFEKYVPAQSSAKVSIASVFDKEAFDFMAQLYVIDLDGIAGGRRITLAQACEMNYRVATKAHKYRTAKSWQAIKCIVLSEDAAAEKAARKPLPDLFSAHHINSMVARKAIGFDTGGDLSVNASGGTTPMPSRSPRTVATTPTPKKAGEFAEPPLRLPPAAFGRSPSSSTFSTDGDDSAAERLAAAFAGSDSDAPRKLMRLNLTIETNGSSFKAQDFTFQNGDGTNGVNKHTRAQLSVDENQLYPLLTSTTDRSDPLETSMSFKMPTAFVDIGSANAMHHQSQLSQTMALPLSPTTQDDNSFDSPSLGRQFSLVSEQTDSSYGVLGGRSSDMSDSESPHNLGGQTGMYSLPPITEEKTMPPTPWPQANTPARVPSALAYDYSQREEKPWSSRRFVDKIITHSTTHGDVQLAATLILLLHKRIEFTQDLVEEVLDGYLMLLTRLRHFSTAALVRKLAPSETMRMTGQFNVDVDLSCGFCGRAVGGRGGGWCQKCTGKGGAECVICGQVGKGRWTVCAECGHGGCEGCMRGWFLEGEEGEGEGEGDGEGVQGSVQEAVEGDERCAAVGCPCVCLPRKQNES